MRTEIELSNDTWLLIIKTLMFGTDVTSKGKFVVCTLCRVSKTWRNSVPRFCTDYVVRDLGIRGTDKRIYQNLFNLVWVIWYSRNRGREKGFPYRLGDVWNYICFHEEFAERKKAFLEQHQVLYNEPYNPDERLRCAETQPVPGARQCVLLPQSLGDCHLLFMVPPEKSSRPYGFGELWGYGPNYNGQLGPSEADLHKACPILETWVIAAAACGDVTVAITIYGECYWCGFSHSSHIVEWQPLSAWNNAKVGRAIDVWTDGSCFVFLTMESAVFFLESQNHQPIRIDLPEGETVHSISLSSNLLAIIMEASQGKTQTLWIMDPCGANKREVPPPIPKGRLLRVAIGDTHMVLSVQTKTGDTKVYTALIGTSDTDESWYALAQGELGKDSKGLQVASGLDGATAVSAANYTTGVLLKSSAYISCDQDAFPFPMGRAKIGENDGTPKKIDIPDGGKAIGVCVGPYHCCVVIDKPPSQA